MQRSWYASQQLHIWTEILVALKHPQTRARGVNAYHVSRKQMSSNKGEDRKSLELQSNTKDYPIPREDPVTLPSLVPKVEPVKQSLLARIPVEYHGVVPAKFADDQIEWIPIYRLPYLLKFRSVIRFKIYLTAASLAACSYRASLLIMGNHEVDLAPATILSLVTLCGLVFVGDYFRRIICQIYATNDLKYVRICRFSFFGNRRDLVLPVDCVIPLTELNATARIAVMKVRFKMPDKIDLEHDEIEFYNQGLLLPMRLGGVIDQDKFSKVMGNILGRRIVD